MQVTFTYRCEICYVTNLQHTFCKNLQTKWRLQVTMHECPGKSDRVLGRRKLWTYNWVLGPIRFFVDCSNSNV